MAEAGWYADPDNHGWLRYFDGQVWTDHRLPSQPAAVRGRRKLVVICAVVVVLVAGLLTGGWFLFLRSSPSPTYQGRKIENPSGVLSRAEGNLAILVTKRHGVKSADTRCYYAVARKAVAGVKKTDVDSDLRCGPVLVRRRRRVAELPELRPDQLAELRQRQTDSSLEPEAATAGRDPDRTQAGAT